MKTFAVLGALFLALFGMVHVGWVFLGPETPSPIEALLVAIGPTVITIVLYAAGTAAAGYVLTHSWMGMRYGLSWAENNRRPPKTIKKYADGEEYEVSDRADRKAKSVAFGVLLALVGAGFMIWGGVNTQFIFGTVYAWFIIGAQVRLFMARQAQKT